MLEVKPLAISTSWTPWRLPEFVQSAFSVVPQNPIFHYTSQQGLLGIFKTKKLWASNIHYLNDSAEFKYALDLFEREIRHEHENPNFEASKLFCEEVLKWLGGSIKDARLFVVSFSERGDLLSQWRAYCPDGIGFSIGFTYDQLKPAMEEILARLVKCEYNVDKQVQIVKVLISHALSSVDKTQITESAKRIAMLFATAQIVGIGPVFKDPAFSEEQEWRILIGPGLPHHEMSFRPGKSMIIPYCNFPLCKENAPLQVEKIFVGPNPHGSLSRRSVFDAMLHNDVIVMKEGICISTIPYRPW